MATAVLLTLLGALSRLIPHPPNFVALGALALYSGARLPRRWAWAVPLAAMALSDLALDIGTGRAAISPVRLTVYATFAAIVLAGRFLRDRSGAARLASFSLGASMFFFATSNLAEWMGAPLYPKTPAGLLLCYAAAVPFLWATLAADILGTAALFGLDAAKIQAMKIFLGVLETDVVNEDIGLSDIDPRRLAAGGGRGCQRTVQPDAQSRRRHRHRADRYDSLWPERNPCRGFSCAPAGRRYQRGKGDRT